MQTVIWGGCSLPDEEKHRLERPLRTDWIDNDIGGADPCSNPKNPEGLCVEAKTGKLIYMVSIRDTPGCPQCGTQPFKEEEATKEGGY